VRVEQDGGRLRLIDVDPHAHSVGLEPLLDVERPAAHAQRRVRADDKDGADHTQRS
jgi:hypothetical protein